MNVESDTVGLLSDNDSFDIIPAPYQVGSAENALFHLSEKQI